ncbi:ABC transporter permease [Clostridium lacusfryxellense]|uniref:ABC transporter permease n=1 Tax=Clostridium lacusfryxellense TaxID=205328 RepID=UPI001C0B6A7E|nr:ABC transporter permease [Clostridium lacusfryxellense]MBU3113843.1 ABC transporter permease [Clostridium lacusfryxellense]
MITRLKTLILKELLIIIRHKEWLIAALFLPVIVFFILSSSFKDMMKRESDISPIKVAIVDNDNSTASKLLLSSFTSNKNFSNFVNIDVCTRTEAKEKFNSNLLTGIIEIPKNFSNSLLSMENLPLDMTLNSEEPLKSSILKNVMQGYSRIIGAVEIGVSSVDYYMDKYSVEQEQKEKVNTYLSRDLIFTALGRSSFFTYEPHNDIPSTTSIEYYVIAIAVLLLMYIGIILGNLLIKERNSMAIKRLLTTPVNSFEIIFSKWISYSIYCTVLLMIFMTPIFLLFNLDTSVIRNLFVFIIISVGLITSFYIMLATFFNNEESYILMANIYVFISAIIGGSFIPLQLMPENIRNISKLTPNYWIIKGNMFLINLYSLNDIKYIIWGMLLLTIGMLTTSMFMLIRGKRILKWII